MEEKKVIKLPKKNAQASPTDNSMGDASIAPDTNMNMPDPSMGGSPDMMGGGADPNAIGSDPGMMGDGTDTNMDMGNMGEEPSMDLGNSEPNADRQKKEIQKNIGKACDTFRNYQGQDKEELSKWVEGMLDSIIDDADSAGINDEEPVPGEDGENEPMPQVESVIFTKGQLNKINEMIGVGQEEEKEPKVEKKKNLKNNNSPFSNPKLNK